MRDLFPISIANHFNIQPEKVYIFENSPSNLPHDSIENTKNPSQWLKKKNISDVHRQTQMASQADCFEKTQL
jgi:hypothetical protein